MVIYQNENSHTYKEGMVLKRQKKVPAHQQNSNEGSDKKLPKPLSYLDENGNLVEDKAAKYILLINGIETPVYSSRAVKNHHVTIFSYMRLFFKNDSIVIESLEHFLVLGKMIVIYTMSAENNFALN